MKKITFLALHLGYGGAEQCIINLANSLVGTYEVEIISTYKLLDNPAFKVKDEVSIKYLLTDLRPNKKAWLEALKHFKLITFLKESKKAILTLYYKKKLTIEAIKNVRSDVIISTRALFNKWVGKYANPTIYKIAWEHNHFHGDEELALKTIKSCRNMNTLVLVSKQLQEYYAEQMQKRHLACECKFIPNMLDFIPDAVSPLNTKNVIAVGRLAPEKGMVDLIEVFKNFHFRNLDWHLDLVGDGPEMDKIKTKIKEYDLTNFVTLHGFLPREQVNELLKKSSIYVMTSFTESFGIVLIEAMAFGLPCVAFSSAEGACELIDNNENGFLVDNRDKVKMAERMDYLAKNENLRKEMSQKAIATSKKYYQQNVINDWLDILSK